MNNEVQMSSATCLEKILQTLVIPANFIPLVGGGIGSAMSAAASKMMERRIKEALGSISDFIGEKMRDEEYKEEIVGAVLSALMNIGYENNAKKRQYFASILKHYLENYGGSLPIAPMDYLEMFNSITRYLSPLSFQHLLLLNNFLSEHDIEDAVRADANDEQEKEWWHPYDIECAKIQGGHYVSRAIQELSTQGLIEWLERRGMVARATHRYIVTNLGKEYIGWIANPDDQ